MRRRLIVPALFAVAALAQPQANPKPASLEGKVVNSLTGAPLRKVEVKLADSLFSDEMAAAMQMMPGGAPPAAAKGQRKTYTATTDDAGAFRFAQIVPGTYWLTAKRVGFVEGHYAPKGGSESGGLSIAEGQEMTKVEFRLVPQAAVSGRVLDEDGEAVPDTSVTALSVHYERGRRELMPVDVGTTNDRGEFRLAKLPPGHYYLSAHPSFMNVMQAPPPPPPDGVEETGYVSTYFPNVTDATQASRIDVAAGADSSGFDIRLRKSRVVRVKGKATAADGAPIKSGQIMLIGAGDIGSMAMTMVHDPEGKFELVNVQPGVYTVMTMQMQGSTPSISMQSLVVPEKSIDNVKLGQQAGETIHGKLEADTSGKIRLQGVIVNLMGRSMLTPVFAPAKDDGSFDLKGVNAAPYDLSISNQPDGSYVKSVLFNGKERLGKELDFTEGLAGALTISLGTDGGSVQAAVSLDDKPAGGATVVLLPINPDRRFPEAVKQGSSDANGQVTIKAVPPGDYLAFAWDTVEDGAWYDPEFLKPVESKGVRVTMRPGGSEKVQLKQIPAVQ